MSILEETIGLISEKIAVLKTLGTIVKLEIRLAGLSILPLLLSICMLLIILGSLWLTSMVLIGELFYLAFHHVLLAIVAVLLLNSLVFLGLLKYLSFNLKNMSFEKTRKYLLHKEKYYERKKTIDQKTRHDGKKISFSSKHGKSA